MKKTQKAIAAFVSGVMAVMSTAGAMTYAEDLSLTAVKGDRYTIAAQAEEKIYDEDAQITVGKVRAKAGETVKVPVYLSIPENDFITGIGFKAVYNSGLELTEIECPTDGGLIGGNYSVNTSKAIFCCVWGDRDITVDSTKPICYFTFKVKSDAEGDLSVKLVNHLTGDNSEPIEIIHKQEKLQKNTYYSPNVTYGSVSVTPSDSDSIDGQKKYEGTVYIRMEQNVKAAAGETVSVPVYMELGSDVEGKFITGVGFKADYPKNLTLVDIECPDDNGLEDAAFSVNKDNNIFCATWNDADITVDPDKPVCILKFKSSVPGRYEVGLVNHLTGDDSVPVEVIHKQEKYQASTYLNPVVVNGSVVVASTETSSVTTAATTKTSAVTTTTKAAVTTTAPTKPTDPIDYDLLYWGDVNLDKFVDLEDVVVLSKYLLSSTTFPLENSTAWANADCKYDSKVDAADLSKLIEYNLGKITLDDLGPTDPELRKKSSRYK